MDGRFIGAEPFWDGDCGDGFKPHDGFEMVEK